MIAFDIRPFKGVGPIAFGMTPEQVHGLLGAPRMQRPSPLGRRDERYEGFRVRYTADGGLTCEVTFSTACDVLFAGISLFGDATAIHQLACRCISPMKIRYSSSKMEATNGSLSMISMCLAFVSSRTTSTP